MHFQQKQTFSTKTDRGTHPQCHMTNWPHGHVRPREKLKTECFVFCKTYNIRFIFSFVLLCVCFFSFVCFVLFCFFLFLFFFILLSIVVFFHLFVCFSEFSYFAAFIQILVLCNVLRLYHFVVVWNYCNEKLYAYFKKIK